ncbi:MAG: tetraacyldisaccharide 4'-kinase, partial [Pirellulaceae bacterium]|nr:tetraacyldisaccharide 4'-kinase [Pirellulaceae bacterium]
SRADVLVMTRCDQVSNPELKRIEEDLQKYCLSPRTLIAKTVHQPVALVDSRGVRRPLTDLSNHRLLLFAGIGNPNAFFQKIQQMGSQVAGTRSFPDHYHYQREDIQSLRAWVDEHRMNAAEPNLKPWLVVTTRKDLVKLDVWQLSGVDVVAMEVELQFLSGEGEFEKLVESVALLADRPTNNPTGSE